VSPLRPKALQNARRVQFIVRLWLDISGLSELWRRRDPQSTRQVPSFPNRNYLSPHFKKDRTRAPSPKMMGRQSARNRLNRSSILRESASVPAQPKSGSIESASCPDESERKLNSRHK
jgi:hypothetical protein